MHSAAEGLEQLLDGFDRLWQERRLCLFPIRHHSPACAWHLRRWIDEHRPALVLIEGPRDFDPLVPLILDPETRTPFAVYTTFVEGGSGNWRRKSGNGKGRTGAKATARPRYAGYYPFCDYSPELVALGAAERHRARVRFIDLTFAEQIVARRSLLAPDGGLQVSSLLEESHLRHSRYLAELARRQGCRDSDELWDHLFENHARRRPTATFLREVAAYCLCARLDYDPEALEADGSGVRERAMAAAIGEELESSQPTGPVLVVTGGFHTVALASLLAGDPPTESHPTGGPTIRDGETLTALTRYSFEQLDALNGYASGMPAPYYYQRCWEHVEAEHSDPGGATAAELLVEIGRRSRQQDLPFPLSTADEIVALEQTRRLARLRGHPSASRTDLLDATVSCFLKHESGSGIGPDPIGDLVREVMAGERVGTVPAAAGVPPLVSDFRRRCARLRIDVETSVRRQRSLDLYRSRQHRLVSRFFHSLRFLGAPLASLVGGPDFRRGSDLELMQERWEVGWTPQVEGALIEASVYGATIEEACVARLAEQLAELENRGQGRDAGEPVELLVVACRMGLHRELGPLVELIEAVVLEDPELVSLGAALDQLLLLWQSREPLEAHTLTALPRLAQLCYRRACHLLGHLRFPAEERLTEVLQALAAMREHLASAPELDRELYLDALEALLGESAHATLTGAAAGVLFAEGRLDEEGLLRRFRGHLAAALCPPAEGRKKGEGRTAFLRGLLATGREALWHLPALLAAIDELLHSWEEGEFVRALPELRLAFSSLSPREIDRVARRVASLHGSSDLGVLEMTELEESEMLGNLALARTVRAALERDRLVTWIENDRESVGDGGEGKS